MGHKCTFEDRVCVIDGEIRRITTAHWKNCTEDIFMENLEGKKWIKDNLEFTYCGGYTVTFKGEKVRGYFGKYEIGETNFYETEWNPNLFIPAYPTIDWYKEKIIKLYPELKYIANKIPSQYPPKKVFEIIRMWREHNEIETLIQHNQYELSMNKQLFKLTPKKKKEVLRFVKDNIECEDMTLRGIQTCIKNNIKYKDLQRFTECQKDNQVDVFEYLCKKNLDYSTYKDYQRMAVYTGKNMNDPYWKYPKDFMDKHNAVLMQYENLKAAEEAEKNEKEANKFKAYEPMLKLVSETLNQEMVIEGYRFYIPGEFSEIKEQATKLKQCLITMNYPKKVVSGKSLLIFVRKDNEPIATAEIDYEKRIKQYYADESDRRCCTPNQQLQDCLKKYLNNIIIQKPKLDWMKV